MLTISGYAQIEVGFTSTLTALQHYKSGKLRVIAIAGKARLASARTDSGQAEGNRRGRLGSALGGR